MADDSELPDSPAADRNKGPIRDVLTARLPPEGHLLEIASGLGQHAVHIAAALPGWTWQPSEPDPDARATLAARVAQASTEGLRPPIDLDVEQPDWAIEPPDAILCVNLIHIAPWSVTQALMQGAARWLRPGGPLFLYGPFRMDGAHTADSNARFDADLRARDARWGIRDREAVTEVAQAARLAAGEVIAMPANNHVVVFRKPA